jgi:hypothetical protein
LSSSRDFLLAHVDLSDDCSKLGLVDASLEPTNNIGKRLEVSLVANQLHWVEEGRGDDNVSESDGVTDEVSLGEEVVVEGGESSGKISLGFFVTVGGEGGGVSLCTIRKWILRRSIDT